MPEAAGTARAPASAPAASPRPRPRPRPRRVPRRRLAGGVAWIALAAVLLSGIVFLNVGVLRLNLRLDDLGTERARLRAENAQLRVQASSGAAPEAIRTAAAKQGYREADPVATRYLDLEPASR